MSSRHEANQAQAALTEAEQHFLSLCDTDGELNEEDVDAAYDEMAAAAERADQVFNAIKTASSSDWPSTVASAFYG
jgi:hypothetical protein